MNKIITLLKENYLFAILFLGTAVTLTFWAVQYRDVGFLQLHSIDEYVFHGSLRHMYLSALSGNVAGIFGYGFYQYGFVYFFGNLVVSAPFLWSDISSGAIVAPRIITALFALLSLLYIYKFARLYITPYTATMIATACVAMPAFWYNATWFHPDWVMTFWIIACVYYLRLDMFAYKQNFWIGCLCYGLAVACKYQAITMVPLIGLYVFYDGIRRVSPKAILQKMKLFTLSIALIAGIFVFCNPYILHPMGWNVFSSAFTANMHSNATNHGSAEELTSLTKIHDAVTSYYVHETILALVLIAALLGIWQFFTKPKPTLTPIIAGTFILNFCYLIFFVNKAWQMYYLPTMYLGILVGIVALGSFSKKHAMILATTITLAQIIVFTPHLPTTLTNSRDKSAPDFATYTYQEQLDLDTYITNELLPHITATSTVLITPYTPFSYEKIGLEYESVRVIFGALTEASIDEATYVASQRTYWGDLKTDEELRSSFVPIDFIVLRKDIPFIDTSKIATLRDTKPYTDAVAIVEKLITGKYSYSVLAENKYVILLSRTP